MNSPLKWHGGKHYIAKKLWKIAQQAPHTHRVEVYGGSLAFTLATEPTGYSEVVNDIHQDLMNFWRVLQDPYLFARFHRKATATPFCQAFWIGAGHDLSDARLEPWERAWAFFVRCRQSLAGRMNSFAPLSKKRTRQQMNEQASAWISAVAMLPEVHKRLQRVVILNKPDLEVLHSEDDMHTLFYLDPPYLPETRNAPTVYQNEMTKENHINMLAVITHFKAKIMLSGYDNDLYNLALAGWKKHTFQLPNNASHSIQKPRKTECVWTNF